MSTATAFDPGPYNGAKQGYTKIYLCLSGVAAVGALLMPWGGSLFLAHARHSTLSAALASSGELSPVRLLCADVCMASAWFSSLGTVQGLSKQIRKGGPDADFLDRIRLTIASATAVAAMAFLIAVSPH